MVRLRPAGLGLGAVGVLESLGLLEWVVVIEREGVAAQPSAYPLLLDLTLLALQVSPPLP